MTHRIMNPIFFSQFNNFYPSAHWNNTRTFNFLLLLIIAVTWNKRSAKLLQIKKSVQHQIIL